MLTNSSGLPAGVTVFERGWLSANNILFVGRQGSALVDSGYHTHSGQTLALIEQTLGAQTLDLLINTHLHSDHCGGNSALQDRFPQIQTLIPPGQASFVRNWDPLALTYTPAGQHCPQFLFDDLLQPGSEVVLGDLSWEIHAAPGHDPHSIVLFEPQSKVLISADSLWENGFGVVFPELEGIEAFEEVASTLDLIEHLSPKVIIPGHGKVFTHVSDSLALARRRLNSFIQSPRKHALHAAKVLVKFKLLEIQRIRLSDLLEWVDSADYLGMLYNQYFPDISRQHWIEQLSADLVGSGAAARQGEFLVNA